jgi:hypothetical protein
MGEIKFTATADGLPDDMIIVHRQSDAPHHPP